MSIPEWIPGQENPEVPFNEAIELLSYAAVYARDPDTTAGLTWGYLAGRWGGFAVVEGTLTLADNATNYVVVLRSSGAISTSTSATNWNNAADYARVYLLTTVSGLVTGAEDHRAGDAGIFGSSGGSGSGSASQCIPIAVGDETSALGTGTAKVTFRMPYAFILTEVRASVTTAPTGSVLTVDINESGASVLSTKLTIDATELTSTTAAAAAVISDASLADDAEITIDIDTVGSTDAGAGLKVYLIGTPA